MRSIRFRDRRRGQSLVEYLVISVAVLGALLAVSGAVNSKAQSLMQDTRTQMTAVSGLADSLF